MSYRRDKMNIRKAVVSGQFYPGNPDTLRKTVRSFIKVPESLLEAKAVIAPHAGYIYSGAVAGEVFSSVRLPSRMLFLCPNHTGIGDALALAPAGEWETPLGRVHVDAELNERLLEECHFLREDASAHRYEHSIEVQLPFIQELLPEFSFSAICIGTIDYSALETLGHAMSRVILSRREPLLLVVSSDMTHYLPAERTAQLDGLAIARVRELDPEGLYKTVMENDISMCGFAPAAAALVACRDLAAVSGKLLRYANSGETSGDYDRVVAYAGMVIN